MILRAIFPTLLIISLQTAFALDASRITRVTLYPGSATIERAAKITAGASQLEIGQLPANFDIQTLRLSADHGIQIGEFTVQDIESTQTPNPRQSELEKQIQSLSDQIALLEIDSKSASLVTGYLNGLGASGKPSAPDARNLAATLEAIRHGGQEAYARIHKVAVQTRELEKQRAALQAELKKVQGKNSASRKLRVNLAANRAGEIRISYQVDGPGWQPVYRATLDSGKSTVRLERQAIIAQASGEDWDQVALRLSTHQPLATPEGRPAQPWPLRIRESSPLLAKAAPRAMMLEQAPAPMLAEGASIAPIQIFDGRFATEFEAPSRISLPADGRQITVPLSQVDLPVKLRVEAVPRQDPTAFLIASADLPQGIWLPGQIQLYRDGAYVGSTHWQAQHGERMVLPLGRDDLVRITVNHPQTRSSESGLIEQRRERQLVTEYTVHNRHKEVIELTLLEAAPVSTDEKIKVEKRVEPAISKDNWEDKTGVMAWQHNLPAGASQKFRVDYRISWPKEASIVGLPY